MRPISGAGTGAAHDQKTIELSALIEMVNDLFEGDLSDADRVAFVDHVTGKLLENERLGEQARNNSKEQFRLGSFDRDLIDTVMDGLEKYGSMASQVLGNVETRRRFSSIVLDVVYERFNRRMQPGA